MRKFPSITTGFSYKNFVLQQNFNLAAYCFSLMDTPLLEMVSSYHILLCLKTEKKGKHVIKKQYTGAGIPLNLSCAPFRMKIIGTIFSPYSLIKILKFMSNNLNPLRVFMIVIQTGFLVT